MPNLIERISGLLEKVTAEEVEYPGQYGLAKHHLNIELRNAAVEKELRDYGLRIVRLRKHEVDRSSEVIYWCEVTTSAKPPEAR